MSKEYYLIFRHALNPKVEIADLGIITKQPSAELQQATFKKKYLLSICVKNEPDFYMHSNF